MSAPTTRRPQARDYGAEPRDLITPIPESHEEQPVLNSSSHPASSPSTCPGWCFPPSCIDTGTDTEHSSAPASLDTSTAQMIEAALIRLDGQRDFDDEPGQTLLRVDLTDLRIDGRNVQFDIPAEDLPRFARFLMTRYEEYLFCSAPREVRS